MQNYPSSKVVIAKRQSRCIKEKSSFVFLFSRSTDIYFLLKFDKVQNFSLSQGYPLQLKQVILFKIEWYQFT